MTNGDHDLSAQADFFGSLNSLRHFAQGRCGMEAAERGLEIFRLAVAGSDGEKLSGYVGKGLSGRCGLAGMSDILREKMLLWEDRFRDETDQWLAECCFRQVAEDPASAVDNGMLIEFLEFAILGR